MFQSYLQWLSQKKNKFHALVKFRTTDYSICGNSRWFISENKHHKWFWGKNWYAKRIIRKKMQIMEIWISFSQQMRDPYTILFQYFNLLFFLFSLFSDFIRLIFPWTARCFNYLYPDGIAVFTLVAMYSCICYPYCCWCCCCCYCIVLF